MQSIAGAEKYIYSTEQTLIFAGPPHMKRPHTFSTICLDVTNGYVRSVPRRPRAKASQGMKTYMAPMWTHAFQ